MKGKCEFEDPGTFWEMEDTPVKEGSKCNGLDCSNVHGKRKAPEPGKPKGKKYAYRNAPVALRQCIALKNANVQLGLITKNSAKKSKGSIQLMMKRKRNAKGSLTKLEQKQLLPHLFHSASLLRVEAQRKRKARREVARQSRGRKGEPDYAFSID